MYNPNIFGLGFYPIEFRYTLVTGLLVCYTRGKGVLCLRNLAKGHSLLCAHLKPFKPHDELGGNPPGEFCRPAVDRRPSAGPSGGQKKGPDLVSALTPGSNRLIALNGTKKQTKQ